MEALKAAYQEAIDARVEPISLVVNRVRTGLDELLVEARRIAEAETLTELFATLGRGAPIERPEGEARQNLLAAIDGLVAFLASGGPAQEGPKVEPTPPKPALSPEEAGVVQQLLTEIDDLSTDDHPLRLTPLLQAMAAEIRLWLDRVPSHGDLYHELSGRIPFLGKIRREAGIEEFVKGLSRDHRADWARVAREARAKVKRYDLDAGEAVAPRKDPSGRDKTEVTEKISYVWPDWPSLRSLERPVYLVGGLPKAEKVAQVRERFGIDVQWYAIEASSAKATSALLERVRNGSIGAVVLLEGLVSHTVSDEIRTTCLAEGTPFAFGDRAGIADLSRALEQIEGKCGESNLLRKVSPASPVVGAWLRTVPPPTVASRGFGGSPLAVSTSTSATRTILRSRSMVDPLRLSKRACSPPTCAVRKNEPFVDTINVCEANPMKTKTNSTAIVVAKNAGGDVSLWVPKAARKAYTPTGVKSVDTLVYLGKALQGLQKRKSRLEKAQEEADKRRGVLRKRSSEKARRELATLAKSDAHREKSLEEVEDRLEVVLYALAAAGKAVEASITRGQLLKAITAVLAHYGTPMKAADVHLVLDREGALPLNLVDSEKTIELLLSSSNAFARFQNGYILRNP